MHLGNTVWGKETGKQFLDIKREQKRKIRVKSSQYDVENGTATNISSHWHFPLNSSWNFSCEI